MLVGGVSLALFPLAVAADHSLLLEPYLVCFCLLGTIALFTRAGLASQRRVLLAGLALGFAGSIKLWAVLPAAAALIACIPIWRRGVRPLAAGLFLGFVVPSLPFFLLAPRAFVHDVFIAQAHRGTAASMRMSIAPANRADHRPERAPTQREHGLGGRAPRGAGGADGRRLPGDMAPQDQTRVVHPAGHRDRSAGDVLLPRVLRSLRHSPAAFLALLLAVCAGQLATWARPLATRLGSGRHRVLATVTTVVLAAVLVAVIVATVGRSRPTRSRS